MTSALAPSFNRSDAPSGEIVVALRQTGALRIARPDLYRVESWSLASEQVILTRTVKVVVAGNGAY